MYLNYTGYRPVSQTIKPLYLFGNDLFLKGFKQHFQKIL